MDVKPVDGRAKLTQLCFEDFLEALVRVATTKTLPTPEQVPAAIVSKCHSEWRHGEW